jgi:hypothetical protein
MSIPVVQSSDDFQDKIDAYAIESERVAYDLITRSTRFEVADIRFRNFNPRFSSFTVRVSHRIEVVSSSTDYKGLKEGGAEDYLTWNWQEFTQGICIQEANELANMVTRQNVLATIKCLGYATYVSRSLVRTHPRRLFHPCECSNCHGHGEITCQNCLGSGNTMCHRCYGAGKSLCLNCQGQGSVSTSEMQPGPYGPVRYTKNTLCTYCCHTGRIQCQTCRGKGKLHCNPCGGSGRLICTGCAGHGVLTRVVETQTYVVPSFTGIYLHNSPDYLHDAACKIGFENLGQHADLLLSREAIGTQQPVVEVEYQCMMPTCDMEIEVVSHWRPFVVVGKQHRPHDAGGILEKLVEGDYVELIRIALSRRRYLPGYYKRASPALRNFFKSEVHQEMTLYSAAGYPPAAVHEKIHRLVSLDYVKTALVSIQEIGRATKKWALVKYWIFVGVSAPIVLLLGQLPYWMHRDFRLFELSRPNYFNIAVVLGVWSAIVLLINRWSYGRWLRSVGGWPLASWFNKKKLHVGIGATICATTLMTFVGATLFEKYPVRVDMDRLGRPYGVPPSWMGFPAIAARHEQQQPTKPQPAKVKPRHRR